MAKSTPVSLKRQLITYTSLFSIVMGCLLVIAAYRIALEETNEILDAQMRNLAERVAAHDPAPIKSEFEADRHYHEEDLFVDVWSYGLPEQRQHEFDLLIQPVKKAGFYTHHSTRLMEYLCAANRKVSNSSQSAAQCKTKAGFRAGGQYVDSIFTVYAFGFMGAELDYWT
jgi:hypothetical protein